MIVEQVFIRLITIRCTLERAVQSSKENKFFGVNLQSLYDVRLGGVFFFCKVPRIMCLNQERREAADR